jgi:soluble lytic murein transglycosylase-like protein
MTAFKTAASRTISATRALLALVGLITLLSVAWPSYRDTVLQHIATLAVAAESATMPAAAAPAGVFEVDADGSAPDEPGQLESPREQRALAVFIARRYRVAEEASQLFVRSAYDAGSELAVDPLLILAIMAIESSFNPVAQSSMGAMGLMQVIPRFHLEKLEDHGGQQALLDPAINIRVGAQVLHEYMRRYGNMQPALQKYAGAFDEPNAHYTNKVLAEKALLKQVQARTRREA